MPKSRALKERYKSIKEFDSKTIDLILSEIKDELKFQFDNIDALDTKSSIVVGFTSVVIGLTSPSTKASSFLFLGSIILSLLSYFPRFYTKNPSPRYLAENFMKMKNEYVKKQLISRFIYSIEKNDKIILKKINLLRISLVFLFIGVFLIFFGY